MRKNAQKVIAIGFLFLAFAFYLHNSSTVKAAFPHNVTGQAWSTNIGWINFSCDSTNTCGSVDYGVNIDVTNVISGHAWSNNVGWISFNSNDLVNCSSVPCTATYNPTTGDITGWARACGGTLSGTCGGSGSRTDGWDGWIKLNSASGVTYQAKLNAATNPTGSGSGQAWGSDVVGWIDFSGVKYNPAPLSTPIVTTNAATSVTSTSANLSGSVNVNGSTNIPLTLRIEWGTSPSLASYTTLNGNGSPLSSGSLNFTPFSPTTTGLTPSTTYYFRMAAIGADITRYTGNILSFTTTAAVPTPTVTLLANGIPGASSVASGSSVTLSWSGTNLKTGGNYCNISGTGNGTIPPTPVISPSGSTFGWAATNPPATVTTYQIWCYGTDGVTPSNTSVATVTINPPVVLCDAPALNAGSPPPCTYAPGLCTDFPNALNYGQPLPCTYASGICEDPIAINAGQAMPCKYRAKPKWWEF